MKQMSSKERVLAAMSRKAVDYVPCSPFFHYLSPQQRKGYTWGFPWGPTKLEEITYCVEKLDLDMVVDVPIPSYFPGSGVSCTLRMEGDVIHKAWKTPAGELHAAVRYTPAWRHGFDIPFYSDFNVGHYVQPWLKSARDLQCLRHILQPPKTKEQFEQIEFSYAESGRIADQYELATISSIGLGLTGAQHLCGAEQLCLMMVDQPDLVDAYLQLEHECNLANIEIALDLGVDIIRRNGFYETADFYSPPMLAKFLSRRLNEEAELVRQAGKKSGYTVHTGLMPILDHLAELNFDCLMQLDTAFKGVDLNRINQNLSPKKSFWTGPSNTFHMWSKDPQVVRRAVSDVFEAFGKEGLLITACPSVQPILPWRNTLAMIDEWKRLRSC